MKTWLQLVLIFAFTPAMASEPSGYIVEFLGANWVIVGEKTENKGEWMPSVTVKNVEIYQADSEGYPYGDKYLLAVNSNGWGDRALNVICNSLTGGRYPYADAPKTTAGGFFKKKALIIVGDSNQEGEAVDYKIELVDSQFVIADSLSCYKTQDVASEASGE